MIQASILNMLGQVLQLKFNYSLLDANNIFMEFILKLLESIENGTIRFAYSAYRNTFAVSKFIISSSFLCTEIATS